MRGTTYSSTCALRSAGAPNSGRPRVYKHLAPLEPEQEGVTLGLFDLFGLTRAVGFRATVQSLAHVWGVAGLKNKVQYSAAGTETSGHAVGGVMIEVMFLHVAEIGSTKIAELGRVVDPLFGDISLESEGQHNRSGEGREKKNTERHAGKKERQQIADAAAHVFSVERFLMMSEMR